MCGLLGLRGLLHLLEFLIAQAAFQRLTQRTLPTLFSHDPRPYEPGWLMPYVLPMAAFEFGNPLLLLVLNESNDASLHEAMTRVLSPDPICQTRRIVRTDRCRLMQAPSVLGFTNCGRARLPYNRRANYNARFEASATGARSSCKASTCRRSIA